MRNIFALLCLIVMILSACSSQHKIIRKQGSGKPTVATRQINLFIDAELSRLRNQPLDAIKQYELFLKSNATNATANYNMARLQLQKSNIESAEKYASLAVKYAPDNKFFHELLVRMLVTNRKMKAAEIEYNHLIKNHPENEEYVYNLAMLYLRNNQLDKALNSLNALETKTGYNEDIVNYRKSIYLKQGKTTEAIREIQKLKMADKSSPKYDLEIAEIYENENDTLKRKEIYEELKNNYPGDPLAELAIAQYYLEQGNNDLYDQYMLKVMKNKNLDAKTKIGLILPTLKRLDNDTAKKEQMILMAKSIAEESSESKEAVSLYADVLYFVKRFDEALIQYEKYLNIDKDNFSIWSQLISIYIERQQMDSVLKKSIDCISYFPKNPIPYFYAGTALLQKSEPKEAIKYFTNGLEHESSNKLFQSQFYASLGEAFNSLKEYEKSDSCFDASLERQPAEPTTLNNYAYYLSLRKERLDEAEKMSKKSLEMQPDSKSFLDTYGWILYQKGDYKNALIYIQKAIDSNGQDDGTLFEHLGDVYFQLNEPIKAKENWLKATNKGENNPTLLKKIQNGTL